MQATPLFLGACALASIAGVVSGTTIDTRPIQRGGIGMQEIARPAIDFASDEGLSEQVALPDHYAIRTPEGLFEVAELSSRGIYAQRRFAARDAAYSPPPMPVYQDVVPEWPSVDYDDELVEAGPQIVRERADEATAAEAAPDAGTARVIDVDAVLAVNS